MVGHIIDLTYAGLGIPEELVAYVADQQNYYEQEGVHVALRDGRAWDGERIRRTATIGLGRAVVSRLTGGIPRTVLSVNTDRPLFWLLARDACASVEELKGRRIGIHPPQTAPGCFSRIVLRRLGLDPDHDVQPVVMTPGDYGRAFPGRGVRRQHTSTPSSRASAQPKPFSTLNGTSRRTSPPMAATIRVFCAQAVSSMAEGSAEVPRG
jgi:ABC-type nitrate/sulfonate/bicarbonate transport system substrate-binding protein